LPKKYKLLNNISTIANLAAGAYGMYVSSENRKVLSPQALGKIRLKFGDEYLKTHNLGELSKVVIKKYFPDIADTDIKSSDIIHVNVNRIVKEFGDSFKAILEIAKTIVHESTHEIERETLGWTNEIRPQRAELVFEKWVHNNLNIILKNIPQLNLYLKNPSFLSTIPNSNQSSL
jgi:hypothetical protein